MKVWCGKIKSFVKIEGTFVSNKVKEIIPGALVWPPGTLCKLVGWQCAEGPDNPQYVLTAAAAVGHKTLTW